MVIKQYNEKKYSFSFKNFVMRFNEMKVKISIVKGIPSTDQADWGNDM